MPAPFFDFEGFKRDSTEIVKGVVGFLSFIIGGIVVWFVGKAVLWNFIGFVKRAWDAH